MPLKCGLLGASLRHSYSKQIHEIFGDYEYEHYSIDEEEAARLITDGGFDGLNVTIPYKKLAFSLCDEVSDLARSSGSVNTIVYRDGRRFGYNTDCFGFRYMASQAGIPLSGKKVTILGSGGTSETAQMASRLEGASEIRVVSRNGELNYENLSLVSDTEILINTTPVGMYPKNGASPVSLDFFPKCEGVIDVIYNPLTTALLADAKSRNIPCTNGINMLSAQGKLAAELFCGTKLPDTLIDKASAYLMREFSNIVLIGMPGSGKTTVGRILAEKLSRKLFDTDEEISSLGRTPAEIIERDGEAAFRKIETEICAKLGKERSLVISTGGGAVEREENLPLLSQNGRIYLIERDLGKLATRGRPLSTDVNALYAKRRDKYLAFCDKRIENNKSPEETAEEIISDFLSL